MQCQRVLLDFAILCRRKNACKNNLMRAWIVNPETRAMTLPEISSPVAAFIVGLVTSVHCLGMCGPLACSFCMKSRSDRSAAARFLAMGAYHGGRIISYSIAGLLAGALGASVAWIFTGTIGHLLPWAMVVLFLVIGFGLERKLHPPNWITRWFPKKAAAHASQHNYGFLGPLALGLATVLLPCGPLYMVLAVAVVSGSSFQGAEFMAAFALGTIPLIALMQSSVSMAGGWFSPIVLRRFQRGIAFACAGIIVWRAVAGAEFHPSDPAASAASCCH